MIETIDAMGSSAKFEYDSMGNLIKTSLHRVDTQDQVDEWEITVYEYDGRGLQTKVVDALGNVTQTEYDGNGNISKVTDADGFVTEYTYNALDLVTSVNYNGGKKAEYAYNATGELLVMEDTDPSKKDLRQTKNFEKFVELCQFFNLVEICIEDSNIKFT